MSLSRMIICLLILCLPPAICQAANEEKFSTDWITPPIDSISFVRDVCAIDLAIRPRGQGWSESLDLRNGANLTNRSVEALKKLPNLRKIIIFGTRIDSSFFQKELPNFIVERKAYFAIERNQGE